jgi:hypothetical protein
MHGALPLHHLCMHLHGIVFRHRNNFALPFIKQNIQEFCSTEMLSFIYKLSTKNSYLIPETLSTALFCGPQGKKE